LDKIINGKFLGRGGIGIKAYIHESGRRNLKGDAIW